MTVRIIPNKCISIGRIVVNVALGWEKNLRQSFVKASKCPGSINTGTNECFTILKSHTFFLLWSIHNIKIMLEV